MRCPHLAGLLVAVVTLAGCSKRATPIPDAEPPPSPAKGLKEPAAPAREAEVKPAAPAAPPREAKAGPAAPAPQPKAEAPASAPRPDAKVVEGWIAQLDDANGEVRLRAVVALYDSGKAARAALPVLRTMQQDEDYCVRLAVMCILFTLEPEKAEERYQVLIDGSMRSQLYELPHRQTTWPGDLERARPRVLKGLVPGLKRLVENYDSRSAFDATRLLGELGPYAEDALPALAKALKHSKRDILTTVKATIEIGPAAMPFLAKAFKDSPKEARRAIVQYLAGPMFLQKPEMVAKAIPIFREALKDSNPTVRRLGAERLVRVGRGERALKVAVAAMAKNQAQEEQRLPEAQRGKGLRFLGYWEPLRKWEPARARKAAAQVAEMLDDPDPLRRRYAIALLGILGPAGVGGLKAALKDKDPQVRAEAERTVQAATRAEPGKTALPAALFTGQVPEDPGERLALAEQLGRLPAAPKEALPLLLTLFRGDARGAAEAAKALPSLSPEDLREAVPELRRLLGHENARVRGQAAIALGTAGAAARPAIPRIKELGRKPEPLFVRGAAIEALWRVAPEDEALLPLLRQALREIPSDEEFLAHAVKPLCALARKDEESLRLLAGLLERDDHLTETLLAIFGVLEAVGPDKARVAIPALKKFVADPRAFHKVSALVLILRIDPGQAEALRPAILPILRAPDPKGALSIVEQIGELGPRARGAVPVLEEGLKSSKGDLARACALALFRVDPGRASKSLSALQADLLDARLDEIGGDFSINLWKISKPAKQAAALGLKHPDASVRRQALEILALVGGYGRELAPDIEARFKDEDPSVRATARAALMGVAPGRALQAGVKRSERFKPFPWAIELTRRTTAILTGPDKKKIGHALFYLPFAAPIPEELLTALDELVRNNSGFHRDALRVMVRIGAPAVPHLRKLWEGGDVELRIEIAEALARIGPAAAKAAPELRAALKDEDTRLRLAAAKALVHVAPDKAEEAIPVLVTAAAHRSDYFRKTAAEAMGALRPGTKGVGEVLARLTKDKNPVVRVVAASALAEVDPERIEQALAALLDTIRKPVNYNGYSTSKKALDTLLRLGPKARPLAPELVKMVEGDQAIYWPILCRALRRIDPDAARKAGIR